MGTGYRDVEPTPLHANPVVLTAVPVGLGVASLLLAPISQYGEPLVQTWLHTLPTIDHAVHLGLWHGFNVVLALSLVTLLTGLVLFRWRVAIEQWQRALPHPPAAVRIYRAIMQGLDRISLEVTGLLFKGSLQQSLSLILIMFVAFPGTALLLALIDFSGRETVGLRWYENPAQLGVAVLTAAAAIAAITSLRRFRAVFLVGFTGYALALLFLLHGAPDLA